MSNHARNLLVATSFVSLSLFLITANAETKRGPFPIVPTQIDNMGFTFKKKLEAATWAIDVARATPSGTELVDGVLTLLDPVTVRTPSIDPVTQLPLLGLDGMALTTSTTYPAGTVLNPIAYPSHNILIPKNVMVSTMAVANNLHPIGRFGYIGVAPRFESKNLEMVASKMGHSLRVKAWVTQDILDTYEYTLLSRFKSFSDMFAKRTIHLEPLRDLKRMAMSETKPELKKWYTVASYYANHLYENSALDIYHPPLTEDEYKRTILTVMIRTFTNDSSMTVERGLDLFNQYARDPSFLLSRRAHSANLFKFHMRDRYTEGAPAAQLYPIIPLVAPKPIPSPDPLAPPAPVPSPIPTLVPHADALGFLTFVYPIAIDKRGPFQLPTPGLRKFPLSSSVEGRWFSNRWLGEFGGFPFLQITPDGVAFHGPITMGADEETWYLRRDNVSHSCMRMDPSDLMELRSLIPRNMKQLQKLGQTIPLQITEWPDVTDIDNNGTNEVVDVAYYSIPTTGAGINNVLNWRPSVYNKNYWTKFFTPYVKKLKSKNTFTITTTPTTNMATGEVTNVNTGVFTGLPKYEVVKGVLKVVGYYSEPTPIMTMPQRPTQIIQFREDGTKYQNADADGEDRWGQYYPAVVNKF